MIVMRLREEKEQNSGTLPYSRRKKKQIAETLSGGEQQMLAIARGLMSNPELDVG